MLNKINKTISILLTIIFITGIFPPVIFAQPTSAPIGEVKGFNRAVIDSHFSKADRELNPEQWLAEAKFGITQAICAWELIAGNLYENPLLYEEAKAQIVKWSDEELEKRFSQWLTSRFFGKAAESALLNLSSMINESQKNYTWHLDEEGNILFDDNTGDPLVIRPNEEGREFSLDLALWRNETGNIVKTTSDSFNNEINNFYPELLTYIPNESRESLKSIIKETINIQSNAIKREFENIIAREERIFTNRRTRDIWSLRKKSDDESARLFTEKLIAETDESCKRGIEELNARIEQASAGTGDLALLGEEWLRLYQEQFERGLKAWEDAEERFFIRRIEWEQDSFKLFSEGEEVWLSAFNQFEEERQKWELNAKELFQTGELLFKNISEDFEKTIADAKKEFELNAAIRIGEGTNRVKALIDMYLVSSSAMISSIENIKFWQKQYDFEEKNAREPDFSDWLSQEMILSDNENKSDALIEIQKSYNMYLSYKEKSLDVRDKIYENYSELFETGALKDILSPSATSDDFYLDEYQIALIRAKALVQYWERKTSVADAVMAYANELSSGRMTDAEGLKAWEDAKNAYNNSLIVYETELNKLNKLGEDLQKQKEILNNITIEMQKEEDNLNNLYSEYSTLISISSTNIKSYYSKDFNEKYISLVERYKKFQKNGIDSEYYTALEYGLLWEITEQREITEEINNILETNNNLSNEEKIEYNNILSSLSTESQKKQWENICNSLSQLFNNYDLKTETQIIPDVNLVCLAIINKPGDLAENTSQFLMDFDNCFPAIHTWLQYEIDKWKEALINYVSTYALNKNIQPELNTSELADLYYDLSEEYNNLYQYAITYEQSTEDYDNNVIDRINNEFKNIYNNFKKLDYMNKLNELYELMKSTSLNNDTHWRQYLLNNNIDPALTMVSSWKDGILADALYYATYYTNRINDSLNIYSNIDKYNNNKNAEQLYYSYSKEIETINNNYSLLVSKYDEISNAGKLLALSELSSNDLNTKLSKTKEAIDNKEKTINTFSDKYYKETQIFLNIGSEYDNQYNKLIIAYNNTDQKRFEYEKQDAIQRWASTSYINTDNIDPDSCRANLLKAQTVLNVLSDILNNNNSNDDPKYNALYAAYEQSFINKFKIIEVYNTLSSKYIQEMSNNEEIYQDYRKYLFQLGIDFNYNNYSLPESKENWKIENIITVKNGLLAFSRDESMNIIGVNSTAVTLVEDFFNNTKSVDGEYIKITDYEKALRDLSQRLTEYFKDPKKFEQWSYARNYLLLSLKNANDDIALLNNFSVEGELSENGSIGSEYIKLNPLEQSITLYSYMNDNYFKNNLSLFENEWNKLSEEEKADLEFYIILTLTTGNEYFYGFRDFYTYQAYLHADKKTMALYKEAQTIINTWLINPVFFLWFEPRDINKNTNNRIQIPLEEAYKNKNRWINELNSNLSSINYYSNYYKTSIDKLNILEVKKTDGSKITWDDINSSLSDANIKSEDIAIIKNCWETMQKNSANTAYKSIFEALSALSKWANDEEYNAKNNLESSLSADIKNQKTNEDKFLSIVDDYFKGTKDIKAVKTAAENAYGNNSVSAKNYFNKMYNISINNISMYMTTDINLNSLFNNIGENIVSLTTNTILNRYNAEFSAREIEWDIISKDLKEKYNDWQNTAMQILENGRTDWNESYKKLVDAYKQWNLNFQNEYNRVNDEWILAYLAGLEDKEEWLQQAANAANQASSEAFLSLVGMEGERLSRFIDTREPLGIRDAVPQAQTLMTSLLQSSGIINMASAFNSLNNFTNITFQPVKRGIGGVSTWDSGLVKLAASDLAKKTNTEIANNESKKLAYIARKSADDAINSLTVTVNTANQSFRESIDNIFIKGLWRKNGNNYVKDIIKGSTVFEPVITETVTVNGYTDYNMEPVILTTNLNENNLANLDSIAIQRLINCVYIEVQNIANKIFGNGEDTEKIPSQGNEGIDREQSPGEFGKHIGYGPDQKTLETATKDRNEIFYDEGSGQLGQLLSDYTYWYIIDKTGSAEFTTAIWDKRMWDDEDSSFSAPTLRSAGNIVGSIVSAIVANEVEGFLGTILSIGIASSTEITLGILDAAYEYKPIDEVAVSVGKTILINTATNLIGSAFSAATNTALSTTTNAIDTILTQTIMTGLQVVSTGIATSIINGITYDSENGFDYSMENFTESMKGTFINTLTSMVSTFTSSSLTAINSGIDYSKLKGFNNLNKSDLQKLNGLLGSLAGQGVNYALGNDFTLNLLNLSLFTNNNYNSGLLELHIGHDDTTMNFGTSGANISIDNLAAAFRGVGVWGTNTWISNYGKKNDFDALIALRVQYGYGDDVQKAQLWDILRGDAILNFNAEGDYFGETTINENRKRVINLNGYKESMSEEDQYLLGVILGYEAYRDGYHIGEIDTNGNLIDYLAQTNEFRTAHIAKILMGDRINYEQDWFYDLYQGLKFESDFLEASILDNKYSLFYDYLDLAYDNSKDYLLLSAATGDDYQNKYKGIRLLDSFTKEKVDAINENRMKAAYDRYKKPVFSFDKYLTYKEYLNSPEYKKYEAEYETGFNEFKKDQNLMKANGYEGEIFYTISGYGCTFMSTKYIIEAFTGKEVGTLDLHQYIIDKGYYVNDNELSRWLMAKIMTEYTNNEYIVQYMENFTKDRELTNSTNYEPTLKTINIIESLEEQYIIHLRVKDPTGKEKTTHSVVVKDIVYTRDEKGNITGISKVNVANPYQSNTLFIGKQSYLPSEIIRWDIFKVTENINLNY